MGIRNSHPKRDLYCLSPFDLILKICYDVRVNLQYFFIIKSHLCQKEHFNLKKDTEKEYMASAGGQGQGQADIF